MAIELTEDDFPPHPTLSPLQQKAAYLLALGWSYRRIASEIGVSKSTICDWSKDPEFSGQIGTVSSEAARRFQAVNLRATIKAIRDLHCIAFNRSTKTSDRLAALKLIIDLAISWNVVRPLEESRRRLENLASRS